MASRVVTPQEGAADHVDRRALPLFPCGVGNTWGDKANFESLINDVSAKIFDRFPDETEFHPGHGKDSTLGAERPSLPEWRARGW